MKNQNLIILTFFVLVAMPVHATTYYVDYAGGADANNGTSTSTPFKHCKGDVNATDTAAAATIAAGDTIIFKGGVQYNGQIALSSSGTSTATITYDGNSAGTWGTGKAIIDGQNTRYYGITAANKSYIAIKNFEIRNMVTNWADINATAGIIFSGASTSISIANCYIHDIGYWNNDGGGTIANSVRGIGVLLWVPTNPIIRNNEITKAGYSGIAIIAGSGGIISGNAIHDYVNWGIDISSPNGYGEATGHIIENNTFHDMYQYGTPFWGGAPHPTEHPHTDYIFIRGDSTGTNRATGNIVRGNLFYNNVEFTESDGTAFIYLSYANATKIYNNVFVNSQMYYPVRAGGRGTEIYNNTFYSPRSGVGAIYLGNPDGGSANHIVRNNAVVAEQVAVYLYGDADTGGLAVTNNKYYVATTARFMKKETGVNSGYKTFTGWQSTFSQDGMNSELFGNTSTFGFTSLSGYPTLSNTMLFTTGASSPLVGAGVDLSSYFTIDKNGTSRLGAPWDIGAYGKKRLGNSVLQ